MRTMSLSLVALLLASLLAVGCQQPSAEQSAASVAFIDQNRVFMQCAAGAKGMQVLQELSKKLQDELKGMQGDAKENGDKETKDRAYQEKLANFQAVMSEEQQRIVGVLTENFNQILDEYRTKHKVAAVLPLEVAISFDKSTDITEMVIAAMNARNISLDAPKAADKAPAKAPATSEDKSEAKPEAAPAKPAAEKPEVKSEAPAKPEAAPAAPAADMPAAPREGHSKQ